MQQIFRSPTNTMPPSCPHLHLPLPLPLRSLHGCLLVRPPFSTPRLRLDPLEIPRCSLCPSSGPRLYACLSCATILCPLHSLSHPHPLSLDLHRAELFCSLCRDQVYHPDFDAAVILATHPEHSRISPPIQTPKTTKKRKVTYTAWVPGMEEKAVIRRKATPVGGDERGLRGLNNLGSTCFMNSVLQALMHTPPLRNYFLSDRHSRFFCGKEMGKMCLACDLDDMYSAVFSGDRRPYSPASFLYSWWRHASNLASYEQQDAHEFFISMLDGIHEKVDQHEKKSHTLGSGDCCIAHRVFSGILRSDVTCTICGFTSTTYDPCIDISLDLDSFHVAPKIAPTKSNSCNGAADTSLQSQSTLHGCLGHFTRPERLGPEQKLFCQHCQVRQESLKQMSIRKLPLVTCFHIKRFEHSSSRKMSKKIDRYLQFPLSLNMGRYLSSSILRSRYGNRIFTFDDDEEDATTERASEFELFAVITHSGKLDAGHYLTFVRLRDQWYRCDDAWITNVSENIVRAAQAYMLFYVQKVFFYEASENGGES